MTDESMDARLRAAGERWRAANETPAGVDVAATVAAHEPEVLTPTPAPRRPRRWGLLVSAAAVAAALAVGGAFALSGGNDKSNRPSTDNAGLVGTVWELVGYEDLNPPPQSPPAPPPPPHLRDSSNATMYIDSDGHLAAADGCEVTGGTAQVGSRTITVTDLIQRGFGCTDSVGDTVFQTKPLADATSYAIDGDTMTISGPDTVLHFVAAPPDLPPPTLDVPTLYGAHWKLVRAVDADGNDVPVDGEIPFAVADDGTLTASDGCNRLSGTVTGFYTVTIDLQGSTEIGCATGPLVQSVLTGRVQETVDGATLTLKNGAGELTYQWVPNDTAATDPQALDGRTWRLSLIAGEPAVSDARLKIDGDTYTANDGCREFSGNVNLDPGSAAFSTVPQNNPPCGGDGADQASSFDSLLKYGRLWAIRDGKLIIWDNFNGQAFSLVFADASGTPPTVTNPADAIVGRDWYLSQISTDEGSSTSGHSVTGRLLFRISSDRSVLLSERCAQGDGTVALTDSSADFAGLDLTDHSCPSGPDTDLAAPDRGMVLEVLDGATTWSLDGDQLSFTKDGSTLTFGPTPPTPPDPSSELNGKTWHLYAVQKDIRETVPALPVTAVVTLTFDGSGGAQISERCAQGTGTVRFTAETAQFAGLRLVLDNCPDGSEQLSNADLQLVDQVLDGSTEWQLDGGQLTFTRGNSALVFKDHAQPPTSLLGSQWKLTGFEREEPSGGGGVGGGSVGPSSGPTFTIGSDGSFVANGGCARSQGQVEVRSNTLVFSDVISTGPHCIDSISDQGLAIDTVFNADSATYDFVDGELVLAHGGATLHYEQE